MLNELQSQVITVAFVDRNLLPFVLPSHPLPIDTTLTIRDNLTFVFLIYSISFTDIMKVKNEDQYIPK